MAEAPFGIVANESDLNLTNGSRQSHSTDDARAGRPARARRGVDRGARRVHVVHHTDLVRHRRARDNAAAYVPPPLVEGEATLPGKGARSRENVEDGEPPVRRELCR